MKITTLKLRVFIAIFVVLIAFEAFWLFLMPFLLNKFFDKNFVETNAYKISDTKIDVTQLKYKTHLNFAISVKTDKIIIEQDKKEIFSANNLFIKMNTLSLIKKEIVFSGIRGDNFNLYVSRYKNKETNILKLLKKYNLQILIPNFSEIKLNIKNYNIVFDDKYINQFNKISGDFVKLDKFAKNEGIILSGIGKIEANKLKSDFNADINLKLPVKKNFKSPKFTCNIDVDNFNLKMIEKYLVKAKKADLNYIDGYFNLSVKTHPLKNRLKLSLKINLKDLNVEKKHSENSIKLKKETIITGKFDFSKNKLKIENFEISNIKNKFTIGGIIENILSDKPKLDIKTSIKNDINNPIYFAIPSEIAFQDNYIPKKLKTYRPMADISGELTIKGKLPEPNISGDIEFKNLYLDNPIAKIINADVKCRFEDKKVKTNAHIIISPQAYVDVFGYTEIYGNQYSEYKITSTNNVPLKVVCSVLIPIEDLFNLDFGILKYTEISQGFGDAKIVTKGTRLKPNVIGIINFSQAKASLKGLNTFIENASGELGFDGENTYFQTDAFIDKYPLSINSFFKFKDIYNIKLDIPNIESKILLDVLTTSTIIKEKFKDFQRISKIEGKGNFQIDITGKMDDIQNFSNIDTLEYNGNLNLKNNKIYFEKLLLPINLTESKVKFTSDGIETETKGKIINSPFNLFFKLKNEKDIVLKIESQKTEIRDLIISIHKELFKNKKSSKELYNGFNTQNVGYISYNLNYSGDIKKFNPKTFDFYANIYAQNNKDSAIKFSQGILSVKNGDLNIKNVHLNIFESSLNLRGDVKNIFSKTPHYNILLDTQKIDLSILNKVKTSSFLNKDIKKIFNTYTDFAGELKGKLVISNNSSNGKISLNNISFKHNRLNLPIKIYNADLNFNNKNIKLSGLNAVLDDVPIYSELELINNFHNPYFKGYITTNLYPSFLNKYINVNLGYPIKLKQEVAIKSSFSGNSDKVHIDASVLIPKGADISYMGANLDETDFERELKTKLIFTKNATQINQLIYAKHINNQDNKTIYPYITLSGKIIKNDKENIFDNLNIKTNNKTNSKFLNILFKKSILKQGNFECDLKLNGYASTPKVLGFIKFNNLDIPLYETVIKDIFADFNPYHIKLKVLGNVLDTNIVGIALIKNNFKQPYQIENLDIKADYLDLDKVFDSISKASIRPQNLHKINSSTNLTDYISFSKYIVNNGNISADKILVKTFPATELTGKFTKDKENILRLSDFDFNIAGGTFSASGIYDFNTEELQGDCIAKNMDANQFSQIVLNMKNQIYGNLDGTVNLKTKGLKQEHLKNLEGNVSFDIKNGKMPKLGSLEYLLKSGNLVKSGITGFTVNNIISVLIPINTGDFSQIKGNINIKNGIAQNIEISSKGENLRLYLTGKVNLSTSVSDMNVYGGLSKKISTLLGPIGNTSLNTLFGIIPGIKLSEMESSQIKNLHQIPDFNQLSSQNYRFFNATINGDINGEHYVQTFKWLE